MIRFDIRVKSGLIILAAHYRGEDSVTERSRFRRTSKPSEPEAYRCKALDTSEGMHRCRRYAISSATAEHLWLPKDALREHVSIATDNTKN